VTTIHPHDSDASAGKPTGTPRAAAEAPADHATAPGGDASVRAPPHDLRTAAGLAFAVGRAWARRTAASVRHAGRDLVVARLIRAHGLTLAGVALVLLIILNSVVAYASVRALQAREQMVGHTQAVLGQMNDVLNALDEAESGQRGYIITGDASYLRPYDQASARINADLSQLRSLTADSAVEQRRITLLKPLIATKMSELQRTIDLRRAGRIADAEREVASGESQRVMDQIRGLFAEMSVTENGLLNIRTTDAREALVGTTVTFILATLTDVALLVVVFALIRRVFTQRERVAAQRSELLATVEAQASQLEATFDALVDGVVLYDAAAGIVRLNRATRAIFGLDAVPGYEALSDTQRVPALRLRDAANRPIAADQIPPRRILRGERLTGAATADLHASTPDGREIVVSATGASIRDELGRIIGAVVVYRDVTERRRLEQRTADALNALLAVGEILVRAPAEDESTSAPVQEASGMVAGTAASVAGQRLVALTRSVFGCQSAAIVAVGQLSVQGDAEQGALVPVAVVGLNAEGERRWWGEVPATSLERYVGEASAIRLRAGDPVLVALERQPRREDADDPLESGGGPAMHREAPHPEVAHAEAALTEAALAEATQALVLPMRVGETLVGLLSMEHSEPGHVYTTGEVLLAQAVARLAALVIERERLLREREAAQSRALALTETNRRMDEFLGVASHELKTPVTSLKLNVQLATRRLRELNERIEGHETGGRAAIAEMAHTVATVSRMLERSDRTMARLTRLVDDLLDMSRIRAGRLELRPEPCDLATIVADAVQEQREVSPGHSITLALPPSGAVPIVADADRIGQVVTNYLTNALKYSKESHPVEVEVRLDAGHARVAVRDGGPGLPPEEREAVWEPFHRAKGIEVVSGSGVGLGLGLYISRTIVERHGGAVGLESAPGAGSTFSFALPLASVEEPTGGQALQH
jgi:signal transduction histidine kinase/CHASE3 domain sensor protein